MEQGGTERQVAGAGGRGEEGFAPVEGHEQQVGAAEFVPEDALADAGCLSSDSGLHRTCRRISGKC